LRDGSEEFSSASLDFGTIVPGGEATGTLNVSVDAATPEGYFIMGMLGISCNSNGNDFSYNFNLNLAVGIQIEDFESGDLSQYNWVSSGNANWAVTNGESYEGTYSVKSGTIGNQQQSNLEITLDVTADSEISFYRKVSSEATYDFLQFFIDGNMMDEWSGEEAWAEFSYAVTQGEHTFQWVYIKDYLVANGDDCGWIDYITFPSMGGQMPPIVEQSLSLPQGWSGISSYLLPADANPSHIFGNIEDELIIVQDMQGAYWPETGMNTIGLWNAHNGYKIKLSDAVSFDFAGYDMVNHTIGLAEGWNLIPVICNGDVVCTELFGSLGEDLQVVKEIAGIGVYWPGEEVMTLDNLTSGKSYMVKMDAPANITFPETGTKSNTPKLKPGGRDCTMTGNSHIISIPAETLATCNITIQSGDIISAIDATGNCCGSIEITDPLMDYALVAFGNDTLTTQNDGFENGGVINLVLEPGGYPILAGWDDNYPNADIYADEGISKLTFMLAYTGVEESISKMVHISPNPATDKINISGINNFPVKIEILDMEGQLILTRNNCSDNEIMLTGLSKGLYILHIQNNEMNVTRKLVIR